MPSTLCLGRLSDMNVPFISSILWASWCCGSHPHLWHPKPLGHLPLQSGALQGALYSFLWSCGRYKTKDADDDYLTLLFSVGF